MVCQVVFQDAEAGSWTQGRETMRLLHACSYRVVCLVVGQQPVLTFCDCLLVVGPAQHETVLGLKVISKLSKRFA